MSGNESWYDKMILANHYRDKGDFSKALDLLEEAVSLVDHDDEEAELHLGRLHEGMALCYESLPDGKENAMEHYKESARHFRTHREASKGARETPPEHPQKSPGARRGMKSLEEEIDDILYGRETGQATAPSGQSGGAPAGVQAAPVAQATTPAVAATQQAVTAQGTADVGQANAATQAPPAGYSGRSIDELVKDGTKDEWEAFLTPHVRAGLKTKLPPFEPKQYKYDDYGYRRLIEHIFESERFRDIISEEEEEYGFREVKLYPLLRSDDERFRTGLEALCSLLRQKRVAYMDGDTVQMKLSFLLDTIGKYEQVGMVSGKVWTIRTEKTTAQVKVQFDKKEKEWIFVAREKAANGKGEE